MTSPFKAPQISPLAHHLNTLINDILKDHQATIIDVGALILESHNDLYLGISKYWNSKIIGFEPQLSKKTEIIDGNITKTILPYAIGDGMKTSFYKTEFIAASSTMKPNLSLLNSFLALPTMLEVTQESVIETKRLDDIEEVQDCDLLKLDIQGGELAALRGAEGLLKNTTVIITETEFTSVYAGQPLFHDIYTYLISQGFILLNLENLGYGAYKDGLFGDEKSQLLWADAIFIKDFKEFQRLGSVKTLVAFLIAHFALENKGCAAKLLALHDEEHGTELLSHYQDMLLVGRNANNNKHSFSIRDLFKKIMS
jgi:FkbM family methyltransferase